MRKNQYNLHIRLDEDERAALEKGLQASGLPLSAYLRKLILGESIQAAPSEELRRLRTEIHQIGNNKFCIENDPREDKSNYHTVVLEDGEEIEEVSFWSEDIKYFEKSAESFKHQHSPKIEELKKYLDELYEAMRKDLGSNK